MLIQNQAKQKGIKTTCLRLIMAREQNIFCCFAGTRISSDGSATRLFNRPSTRNFSEGP